jgi:hypothetical protein
MIRRRKTAAAIPRSAIGGFEELAAGLGVYRVSLEAKNGGAHTLTSKKPVGLQVMGYGKYTSYAYPGGLDLRLIAPPPPAPR